MDIVTDLSTCEPPVGGTAVTIGAYDGVHLGHRALLGELGARARADGLTTAVVTFDRHPATVVRPESAPCLLCDLDQKLELLESAGVDLTVVVPFDTERANETAEEFVNEVLIRGLDARLVVVGEDFHFGHGRKGNVALLKEMGSTAGFAVEGVSLQADDDGPRAGGGAISSTRVRSLVAEGRMEEAADLLGRPHQVRGEVVRGDQRGGPELGFPTANVLLGDYVAPLFGVYATRTRLVDGRELPGVANIGVNPTTGEVEPRLEVWLFDFDEDIYGEIIETDLIAFLRPEEKFPSIEVMVRQIRLDEQVARGLLRA